jgi:hypothetical protein
MLGIFEGRDSAQVITQVVAALGLVLIIAVVVAGLLHYRRRPATELHERVVVGGRIHGAAVIRVLKRHGWLSTDQESATGSLETPGYGGSDLGLLLGGLAFSTHVDAPRPSEGWYGGLLFIHGRTARSSPCLLRVAGVREAGGGADLDVSMRAWGDGPINHWVFRQTVQGGCRPHPRMRSRPRRTRGCLTYLSPVWSQPGPLSPPPRGPVEGRVGFEPTTGGLKVPCSAAELPARRRR